MRNALPGFFPEKPICHRKTHWRFLECPPWLRWMEEKNMELINPYASLMGLVLLAVLVVAYG